MAITAPRGTNDILPSDSRLWQKMESVMREVCDIYGYSEIRTPIFEHTELFERGVGNTTDIVEKEMYTFVDRGDRSITLRPEGTAAVVRSYIEHKMSGMAQPVKLFYIGPMFRYERPQAGRYRQFHQFGVEAFGSSSSMTDAEVIHMPLEIYKRLGINDVTVNINSIGCHKCRPAYKELLRQSYASVKDELCESCVKRYDRNPLRLLDCKVDKCRTLMPNPPTIFDMLCPECAEHFKQLRGHLDRLGVNYVINPRLVRGLDYYSRTTFEYTFGGIGSQDALGGGGRYDSLVEECGGPSTPAVGFACGLERCVLALKSQGDVLADLDDGIDIFVAAVGDSCREKAFDIAFELRVKGFCAEFDVMERSLKANMKNADRLNAKFVGILGEDELSKGILLIRNLKTKEQHEVLMDNVVAFLTDFK